MKKKGQSLLEYSVVAALASMVLVTMSTYVFRSVQAAKQQISNQAQK
ncbi:MAG: hypothetical protein HQL26_10360 [Candidatus Omnitrophica bacterium]|nr:hypothetical protein [Candidatus Omnitrophota bacterium]